MLLGTSFVLVAVAVSVGLEICRSVPAKFHPCARRRPQFRITDLPAEPLIVLVNIAPLVAFTTITTTRLMRKPVDDEDFAHLHGTCRRFHASLKRIPSLEPTLDDVSRWEEQCTYLMDCGLC